MLPSKPCFILLCYAVCCFCFLAFLRYNWQVSTTCLKAEGTQGGIHQSLVLYIFYDLASENIYIWNDHNSVFTFQTSLWAPDSAISLFHWDVLQVSQNMSTLISWPSFQTHLNYYLLRASLFHPFKHNSLPLY